VTIQQAPAPTTAASPHPWPALTRYGPDSLARIALPVGGIGTGTVSLGGRGDLRDWEIVNRPAKGFEPRPAFLAVRTRTADGRITARALEGPLDAALYEGSSGAIAANHGLPRFRNCAFEAAYPFGQVLLSDPDVPVTARLQAFNPLIPGDTEASGIPVAVLRVMLENSAAEAVEASVCITLRNFIGEDGTNGAPRANVNEPRQGNNGNGVRGVLLRSDGVDPAAEQWGTIALATTAPATNVSYRTALAPLTWGSAMLDFWDDFLADGALDEREAGKVDSPVASLAVHEVVPAHGAAAVTFLLTWHFPNRPSWTPDGVPRRNVGGQGRYDQGPPTIGNYYATRYADAWDVAERTAAALPELEARTLRFVEAFLSADLPDAVKEAALYNVSTLPYAGRTLLRLGRHP
jgi:non-lysosomal glucosylceramidase